MGLIRTDIYALIPMQIKRSLIQSTRKTRQNVRRTERVSMCVCVEYYDSRAHNRKKMIDRHCSDRTQRHVEKRQDDDTVVVARDRQPLLQPTETSLVDQWTQETHKHHT